MTGPTSPQSDPRKFLHDRIARAEARLAELAGEQADLEVELRDLRAELATAETTNSANVQVTPESAPQSPAEKVALFRSLFAGRDDVFAKFWQNPKTGRKGYAPACRNEWVRGVCEKPRVKCGECPDQAFIPVTDEVVTEHLRGRLVMGVYPMLRDETCRFLAADFDGEGWRDDVAAFVETSRRFGLDPAVERSRSGDGAHVWFFFAEPVASVTARRLGCHLFTETMERRHELSMRSYDRLFPNQDTMPRGGFGNLIALPLQYEARQAGNTVFVDDGFVPYPDQWGRLATVDRLSMQRVEEIVRDATAGGRVVGLRIADTDDMEEPWLRPSQRSHSVVRDVGPLPDEVEVVVAQRIFVNKNGLPPAVINQIKRLAAFQNPEFFKKQAMRLSTALTPRVINCAEDLPQHVALPRGCQAALEDLLTDYRVKLSTEDLRVDGDALEFEFGGQLTEVQQEASTALLAHDSGVFVAPPGTGKTVVGIEVIAKRACSTLVLVHRTPLLDQWRAQLGLFLDLKPGDIGQIGGGKFRPNGRLDVGMLQSLVRREDVAELVADYGHVVVDECHHVPAVSFERVMQEVRARYVTGLTATPQRRDGHQPIIEFQLGPVRFAIDPRSSAAGHVFEHRLVVKETEFRLPEGVVHGIQELYGVLAMDSSRNDMIVDDVGQALAEGRSPVLLTERREHLDYFAERLQDHVRHLVILRGGMGAKQRREISEQLASIPAGEERLLLATGRFLGEGFDDSRLDTLFLALPVSWKGTLVQYAGRLHRQSHGKSEVRIYDYVDRYVPMLARMFDRRMKGYRAMGYAADGELGMR
ncbi:MAG: DEAD/DEAH box helicase family protein [Candidatus Krumholzibacteriia bacterium]